MAVYGDNYEAAVADYINQRRQIWASKVPHAVKIIALAIVEHMQVGDLSAHPSKGRLMKMCNMPESTFERYYTGAKDLFNYHDRSGRTTVFSAKMLDVAREIALLWPTKQPSPNMGGSVEPTPTQYEGGSNRTPPQYDPPPKTTEPPPNMGDRREEEKKKEPPLVPPQEGDKPKRAKQLQKGWHPTEATVAWARNGTIGATDRQISDQFDKFQDFHLAKGNKFVDWDRAFQTWMRNAKDYGHLNGTSAAPAISRSKTQKAVDDAWFDREWAEFEKSQGKPA